MALLIWCFPVSGAEINREGSKSLPLDQKLQGIIKCQGVTDMKSIDCSRVTDKQLEPGDAVMGI